MSASRGKDAPSSARRVARRVAVPAASLAAVAAVLAFAAQTGAGSLVVELFGRAVELRLHYLASLSVLGLALVAFFASFERRRPQAREVVTVATLSALAVAGRAAFFFVPQFKPVCAIVAVSGVAFGGQTGFLVGAIAGFVSNFLFGQGPYTPWQMTGFGVVGLCSGILFAPGRLPRTRAALCVFGALATFFLYGGTVNMGSVLYSGMPLTPETFLAMCVTAIPFDAVHAAASAFFLFVLADPMLAKLDRLKAKYGLGS